MAEANLRGRGDLDCDEILPRDLSAEKMARRPDDPTETRLRVVISQRALEQHDHERASIPANLEAGSAAEGGKASSAPGHAPLDGRARCNSRVRFRSERGNDSDLHSGAGSARSDGTGVAAFGSRGGALRFAQ